MEKKNTGLKILVGILLIAVIAMGGFIAYDKVLKDKYFSKDSDKPNKIKTDENNNKEETKETDANEDKKYSIVKGTLKTEDEDVVKEIKVNGTVHVLGYTHIDEENEAGGVIELTYDNRLIYSTTGAAGFGDLEYFVFEAKDNKEYVLIKYKIPAEYAYLLTEDGKILKKMSNYVEDQYNEIACVAGLELENSTITIENGSVYYYKYDSLESKENYTAKMNKIKLDINNDLISESKTGEQEVMQLGQCS